MIWLWSCVGTFARDRRGATAVEYALMSAVIGLGLVLVLFAFQDDLYSVYVNDISGMIRNAANPD